MNIGEKFREAREKKNITIREVQDNLKIRSRYLEALENNDFDIIPGEAYVKAFIKSYANFIGLDHFELIEEYKKIKEEELRKKIEEENEEDDKSSNEFIRNKTLIGSIVILIIIVIMVVLIYNIFLLNNSNDDVSVNSNQLGQLNTITDNTNNNTKDDSDILNNNENNNELINENSDENSVELRTEALVNENSESTFPVDRLNDERLPEENNIRDDSNIETNQKYKSVDILVSEKTWLQVLVDDSSVFEGTLFNGDIRSFKYLDNISMKIGNAAGIQVRKDNQLLGPWGGQGEVIKKTID